LADINGTIPPAIMDISVSNIDTLTADDITGVESLYGIPANQLPPNPVVTNFISRSGDFNGDGKQDILWRNTQTGGVDIWYMNGPTILSRDHVATVSLQWKIAGIGDFNGDGISDILWQNTVEGSFVIWLMHGDSHTDIEYPPKETPGRSLASPTSITPDWPTSCGGTW
jgi:hypothetical protein